MNTAYDEPCLLYLMETIAYASWSGRTAAGSPGYSFEMLAHKYAELESDAAHYEFERNYPEHIKLKAIPEAERNAIGHFIEWLEDESAYDICKEDTWRQVFYPRNPAPEKLLALYYGIDQEALSLEKDRMLASYREEMAV